MPFDFQVSLSYNLFINNFVEGTAAWGIVGKRRRIIDRKLVKHSLSGSQVNLQQKFHKNLKEHLTNYAVTKWES